MSYKQFRFAKIFIAMFIGFASGQAIVLNNYWVIIVAIAIGMALSFFLRGRVKEIIADERDYEIAGKSARYTMTAFSIIGCVLSLVFMSLRHLNPIYETIGSVMAYTVCIYLLCYGLIFNYLSKAFTTKKKIWFTISAVILISMVVLGSIRLFSGDEDGWICADGQWQQHGHPSSPAPTRDCAH